MPWSSVMNHLRRGHEDKANDSLHFATCTYNTTVMLQTIMHTSFIQWQMSGAHCRRHVW